MIIGGIYRDELSVALSKVPLLGDIPYLGALFRRKSELTRRTVRLFIIEPRIIDEGIAHHLALGNGRDLRTGILAVDEISNQSTTLNKLLGGFQCQPLNKAQEVQKWLSQTINHPILLSARWTKVWDGAWLKVLVLPRNHGVFQRLSVAYCELGLSFYQGKHRGVEVELPHGRCVLVQTRCSQILFFLTAK